MGQRDQCTAARGAVELGDDQAGELHRVIEGLDLRQHVLAGIAVEHQQHLVGCAVHGFADDPPDLFQLFHQVGLGGQTAGGIDHHDACAASPPGCDRIEGDCARVAAFLGNHIDLIAAAPLGELLACGRPEGVAGGKQHRFAFAVQMAGEFADRGGFAGAVDTGNHHDQRTGLVDVDGPFERREQPDQQPAQRGLDLRGVGELVLADLLTQCVEQPLGGLDAGVARQQCGLEVFVKCLVNLDAGKEHRDAAAGARQTLLEARKPGATVGWCLRDGLGSVCGGGLPTDRSRFACRDIGVACSRRDQRRRSRRLWRRFGGWPRRLGRRRLVAAKESEHVEGVAMQRRQRAAGYTRAPDSTPPQ